jgi:hypothetical protein
MSKKYLRPMLDPGSPRVFNCNEMSRKILAQDPNAVLFFKNKPLNSIVLVKDTVPESERLSPTAPTTGTKLYFPFNEQDIYEGGRTVFLHNKLVTQAIIEYFGEGAIDKQLLDQDMKLLNVVNRLPSLDPFLLKDLFLREGFNINDAYFEVSKEVWDEIESFMLQKFEPLVTAAFPDAQSSDEKARQLIDKIWEAHDLEALQPLITAFRLPQHEALDIFASWRGIVYYSYHYQLVKPKILELVKWLKEAEAPLPGLTVAETKEIAEHIEQIKDQLRRQWQTTETILREYQDSYDKMFLTKTNSSEFLNFLRNSKKTYWIIGNSLGNINHGIYCWDVMSNRYPSRKVPWPQLQGVVRLLGDIFQPEKKTTTSVKWS